MPLRESAQSEPSEHQFADTTRQTHDKFTQRLMEQHSFAALLIVFVVLPACSTKCFRLLAPCIELPEPYIPDPTMAPTATPSAFPTHFPTVIPSDSQGFRRILSSSKGHRYHPADLAIDCDSQRFEIATTVNVFMILIYPMGVPLLFFVLLWRASSLINPLRFRDQPLVAMEFRRHQTKLRAIAFLFQSYQPHAMYYEVYESVRRVILTGVVALLGRGVGRVTAGLIFSLVCEKVARATMPYENPSTNILVHAMLWQIVITYLASLFLFLPNYKSWGQTQLAQFGAALLGINLVTLVLATKAQIEEGNRSDALAKQLRKHAQELDRVYVRVKKQHQHAQLKYDSVWASLLECGGEDVLKVAQAVAERYDGTRPRQPASIRDTARLYEASQLAAPTILSAFRELAEHAGGKLRLPPPVGDISPETRAAPRALSETLKKIESCEEQVFFDYDDDHLLLVNVMRAMAIFETPAALLSALRMLQAAKGPLRIVGAKDQFNEPVDGYRELVLNVVAINDEFALVTELQLHLAPILEAREAASVSLAISRHLGQTTHEAKEITLKMQTRTLNPSRRDSLVSGILHESDEGFDRFDESRLCEANTETELGRILVRIENELPALSSKWRRIVSGARSVEAIRAAISEVRSLPLDKLLVADTMRGVDLATIGDAATYGFLQNLLNKQSNIDLVRRRRGAVESEKGSDNSIGRKLAAFETPATTTMASRQLNRAIKFSDVIDWNCFDIFEFASEALPGTLFAELFFAIDDGFNFIEPLALDPETLASLFAEAQLMYEDPQPGLSENR